MRRILITVILLAAMVGLRSLQMSTFEPENSLTLAAIGFVLLTAFTIAEVGSSLKMPRVTGYILSGVLLGPSVADILSHEVVTDMHMFNTLALGLIATGAGLELDLKQIARVFRTLVATIGLKVVFSFLLVGSVLYTVQSTTHLLPLEGQGEVMAMILLFSVLSIGTSPAIALAIKNETRAKGRLMDLVLGAAVLKDLVVVIGLAVALPTARAWLGDSTGGEAVLSVVAKELGSSLLAGLCLGFLLIAYIRFVHAEMLLFVAAMILLVSEAGEALHLEVLLVFITAGWVVRNFSKYTHALMEPLEMVALPVFVVFFTDAGAAIDLAATRRVLPLAASLVVARAAAYFIAARVGGRVGKESDFVCKHAWLGYLPQAGVTLGLANLAAQQLPAIGPSIQSTGMAMVALNLLIGPLTLRRALQGAGEIEETPQSTRLDANPPSSVQEPQENPPLSAPADIKKQLADRTDQLHPSSLSALVHGLCTQFFSTITQCSNDHMLPWKQSMMRSLTSIFQEEHAPLEQLRDWIHTSSEEESLSHIDACRDLYRRLRHCMRQCQEEITLPLEQHHRTIQPEDSFRTRWRKRTAALLDLLRFGQGKTVRVVPVRTLVHLTFEPRIAAFTVQWLGTWSRAHAAVFEELRLFVMKRRSAQETQHAILRRFELLEESLQADTQRLFLQSLDAFTPLVDAADSPALPLKQVDLSHVDADIREKLRVLEADAKRWNQALKADRATLHWRVELAHIEQHLLHSLEENMFQPASDALEQLRSVLHEVSHQIDQVHQHIIAHNHLCAKDAKEQKAPSEPQTFLLEEELMHRLEQNAARLRTAASVHTVAIQMRNTLEHLPEYLLMADAQTPIVHLAHPDSMKTHKVQLRTDANVLLLHQLLPGIEEDMRTLMNAVTSTAELIHEVSTTVQYTLERNPLQELQEEEGQSLRYELSELAVQTLNERLHVLDQTMSQAMSTVKDRVHERICKSLTELTQYGETSDRFPVRVRGFMKHGFTRILSGMEPVVRHIHLLVQRTRNLLNRIQTHPISSPIKLSKQSTELDAGDLHAYLQRERQLEHVPDAYARLFSIKPVYEPHLFTAYEAQLHAILSAEKAWLTGGPSSALLLGRYGAGRTSMLNLCQLELSSPRLVRPTPLEWKRELGILKALAIELGVPPKQKAVLSALKETKTAVLLDDLQHWLSPGLKGVQELEKLLDMVVTTQGSTFWLVTLERSALDLLEEVMPIRRMFGHTVSLNPLEPEALTQAIERRHQLSGFAIAYRTTLISRLLSPFGGKDERTVYFRMLARLCEGNLHRTYTAWLHSLSFDQTGQVTPHLHRLLRSTLPLLTGLPPAAIALLVQITRFGPMQKGELARSLQLCAEELERHLHLLTSAGLLESLGPHRKEVHLPLHVRPSILQALTKMGAIA